jgi:pimeloyl-ACP methyl ester carboxylesterase
MAAAQPVPSSSAGPPSVLILPGLDGAPVLRQKAAEAIGKYAPTQIMNFPPDSKTTFDELTQHIEAQLPSGEKLLLIAESFSGPIALRIAIKYPERVSAIVLVATFAANPVRPWLKWLRFLVRPFLFRIRPPAILLRIFIMGYTELNYLMPLFQQTALSIKPDIMAARLREAFTMDARKELLACRCPVLLVTGKHDRILGKSASNLIRKLRPDIPQHQIEAGHCVIECWPDKFAREIQDFVLKAK